MSVIVRSRDTESIEVTIKRFNKKVADSRVLVDYRESLEFVSESEKRRSAEEQGKKRQEKRQKISQKNCKFHDTHKFQNKNENQKPSKPKKIKKVDIPESELVYSTDLEKLAKVREKIENQKQQTSKFKKYEKIEQTADLS